MHTVLSKTIRLYRDAYSGHPREVWALTILTFINRMGTMVLPFMSVYITTRLGVSLKEGGMIISAFGFGSIGGAWMGGKLADRIGASRVISLSLLSAGLFFILMQFVTSFWGLFGMIFVTALFGEAYRPAMMVAIGEAVPGNQTGRTMSLIRLAINLGMSAAPTIGGFIAATIGYTWLFWVDGTTCILAALFFILSSFRWKRKRRDVVKPRPIHHDHTDTVSPLRNLVYLKFLLVTFLIAFVFIQWFHTVPVFIKTVLGFDERYIGILLGISSFYIILVEMPTIHAIERSGRILNALKLGMILLTLSYLPFLTEAGLWICFLSVFIWTTGEILFLPLNNSMALSISPPQRRGDYMAWYWMMWSLANIAAPTVGLYIAEKAGFQMLWILIALLLPIGLFLQWQNRTE